MAEQTSQSGRAGLVASKLVKQHEQICMTHIFYSHWSIR